MQKRAPTLGNILVIILFVLSCFGLLMFLWESFGGPLPLKPKGYRFSVAFNRSLALAEQSDVRISGVNIGHVIALKHGIDGRTHATIEVNGQYAPIRSDMHAILRQKSLLGETYVQLTPESRTAAYLPDEGQLASSQVEPSVTLDDILSAFDPKTRHAFQVWFQSTAEGINGRGEQINASFAALDPFVEHANKLVTVLASQEGAVRALVHNTGVVFNALASRDHQLEGFIVNGERTFHAAAESSQAFADAFRALPTFERNSRVALKELDSFAADASPYLVQFRPDERQLALLLQSAKPFAPPFDQFLTSLGPLTKAAKRGLPDLKKSLNLTTPVLENLRPVLHNLDPFLQYTGEYVPEVRSFFANLTAATQGRGENGNVPEKSAPQAHFLTTMQVLSPESLSLYAGRVGTDRSNAYPHTGAYAGLAGGLPVFNAGTCANSAPSVNGPANETISEGIILQLVKFKVVNRPEAFTGFKPGKELEETERENPAQPGNPNKIPAPPCNQQGPFTFNGQTSQFPHAVYAPPAK